MGSSGLPNKPYTAGFGVPASRTTDAGLFHLGCSMGASIRTICALIMGCLTSKIGGPDRRANRRYGRCAGSSLGMRAALLNGIFGRACGRDHRQPFLGSRSLPPTGGHGLTYRASRGTSACALGLPQPVTGSQPGAAWYPVIVTPLSDTVLLPVVMSWNALWYSGPWAIR